MKVRNLNSSSVKTRQLIKSTFIDMLAEKKGIGKIKISELVARAGISRATFYAHFDDIYNVVEEFENEIIDEFFTKAKLLATDDYKKFFDAIFAFTEKNYENYKMVCRADDFLFSAKRLTDIAIKKFTELCNGDTNIKNREFIDIEISIFVDGFVCEYVKSCRGLTSVTPVELHAYSKIWFEKFMKSRCLRQC